MTAVLATFMLRERLTGVRLLCLAIGQLGVMVLSAGDLRQAQFRTYTRFTVDSPSELRRRLDEARGQGWSCARGEIDEAITGISVPLMSLDGRTLAAMRTSRRSQWRQQR